MEDKEIEQLLKESADKIKMKDFSERWEAISDRINESQSCVCQEKVQSTVLVTASNQTQSDNTFRKKVIFSVLGLFVAIVTCLAIVLPITLGRNNEKKYLFNELTNFNVTESEFYDAIAESDLKLLQLSGFEQDSFLTYYTSDSKIVGGSVELTEEELGVYIKLVFYTNNVVSKFEVGTGLIDINVKGYK